MILHPDPLENNLVIIQGQNKSLAWEQASYTI